MKSFAIVFAAALLLAVLTMPSESKPAGAAFSKELDKILSSLSPRSQQVIIDLINIDQGKMTQDERKRQMRNVMGSLDRPVLEELFQLYKTTQ
uniref:ApoC-I n=1 Tax=Steinernema glaseri TaxID=37863 RepID=A0A1I8A8C1_9BILA